MRYGIFCKDVHTAKLVNFLNKYTEIDYIIVPSSKTNKYMAYYSDFDIGISYCCGFIIDFEKERKIQGENRPWFNYHPHPLPEYKGYDAYAKAIAERIEKYGVTLHHMAQEVDAGKIIQVKRFPLASIPVHPNELGNICHYYLLQLFKETIEELTQYAV